MEWSRQHRIKIDGFFASDVHMVVAVVVLRTGATQMVVEGVDPTIENLVGIRQLLDEMVKEIDRKLPVLVQQGADRLNRES